MMKIILSWKVSLLCSDVYGIDVSELAFNKLIQKNQCITSTKISLKLHENNKPVYHKERKVPHALHEKVQNELD